MWTNQGLNLGPSHYECAALTNWAISPNCRHLGSLHTDFTLPPGGPYSQQDYTCRLILYQSVNAFTSVARQKPVEPILMAFCGPGGIRTLVRTTYLTHAKISLLNISGISRNVRFKAIYRLSDAFSNLSWIAGPLKDIRRLKSLITSP